MKTKIYSQFFSTAQKIKKGFGIDNFEGFKKKQWRKLYRLVYREKYTSNDIIQIMKKFGMKKDSTVFIHSSMTEFYNYKGTAEELITGIIHEIGKEGTLIMPSYPKSKDLVSNFIFDAETTPSGAGYLSETFRKFPNVERSINIQHSVCAYGKMANDLVSEHHKSLTAWDQHSPYYKMSQTNTLVFAFGLSYFLGTMIHCTESILRTKYLYFQQFFTKEMSYKYYDANGTVKTAHQLTHDFARKRSKKKIIKRYFAENQFKKTKLSNLSIEVVDAQYTLELYLSLAEQGLTMYSVPSPKSFRDENGKFIKA